MPPAQKPAAKAKAATDEVAAEPVPKTLEWEGVTLNLPNEMPGEIVWLIPTLDENGLGGIVELFKIILGHDQVGVLRQTLAAKKLNVPDTVEVLGDLFKQISDMYGMAEGD